MAPSESASGHRLASVEGGNEKNVVAFLDLIFLFTLKLPIGVVYEYENARSSNEVSGMLRLWIFR